MSILRMSRLLDEQKEAGRPYLEFLHTGNMSAGIYVLPAGTADLQKPHAEEEIYYVIRGRAFFWRMTAAGPEEEAVEAGTVLYVAAGKEHRFHSVAEELVLLVCFAPPEGTSAGSGN
jgi:mannose-6-phosphate isomerase-like protein (cupin superfamily)